jgi:hypothetical protein
LGTVSGEPKPFVSTLQKPFPKPKVSGAVSVKLTLFQKWKVSGGWKLFQQHWLRF